MERTRPRALWRLAAAARRRRPVAVAPAPWQSRAGDDEDAACRRWVESVGRAVLLGVALEQERQAGGAR
jgi:hypothetical protein